MKKIDQALEMVSFVNEANTGPEEALSWRAGQSPVERAQAYDMRRLDVVRPVRGPHMKGHGAQSSEKAPLARRWREAKQRIVTLPFSPIQGRVSVYQAGTHGLLEMALTSCVSWYIHT